MVEPAWVVPRTIEEALDALDASAGARPIAGGTDLAVEIRGGASMPATLVDLGRVEPLSAIEVLGPVAGRDSERPPRAGDLRGAGAPAAAGAERVVVGATASHASVAASPLLRARASALAAACRTVGSRQIRERGTVGGNVANASPAADAAVALLALDAAVRIRSAGDGGGRQAPLESFLLGPGKTALKAGELIVSVEFDLPEQGSRSAYAKMGQRNALAIAIVSVTVVFEPSLKRFRIAVGSAAPTPFRAREAEKLLASEWGAAGDRDALIREAARLAAAAARPIGDIRGSAAYRTALVEALTRTTIADICA